MAAALAFDGIGFNTCDSFGSASPDTRVLAGASLLCSSAPCDFHSRLSRHHLGISRQKRPHMVEACGSMSAILNDSCGSVQPSANSHTARA